VEVVGIDGFEALSSEWEGLALRTAATPLSRPGWIGAWWSAFGRGELCLLTRRLNGELTGVLPLSRRGARLRGCSNVHSAVFDGVALADADLDAMLAAALRRAGAGLVLDQLDSEGRLAAAAARLAAGGGCRMLRLGSLVSSRVEATLSWEEFELGLKSSRRRDVRRQSKRLGQIGPVSFEETGGGEELEARFQDFLRLEGSAWKLRAGTAIRQSPATSRFYEEVGAWAAAAGILRLSTMRVGDRPVSTMLTIDGAGRRFGLKTGYDDEFSSYSPGLIHHLEEIRSALQAGCDLELGTGDEPLKRELRNATWNVETLGLFPRSPRGALARGAAAGRMRARAWASESTLARRLLDAVRRRRAQR
jgi:CelD/BcsL family acetyltransferase involved in cellulose biosynthesis